MTLLIVSPSALLRSAFKELIALVPGSPVVKELGSALRLDSALSEHNPDVVIWDEAIGDIPPDLSQRAGASFSLILLQPKTVPGAPAVGTRGMGGIRVTKLGKPDFSQSSQAEIAKTYVPILAGIFADAEARHAESRAMGFSDKQGKVSLVAIGASTGGPAAVRAVLEALSPDFPCPIALVQHIDTGYAEGYAEWLTQNTRLKVRLARDNDRPVPGEVIVGPTDRHLVCQGESFGLDDGPKVLSQKPAVDRLFSTAARYHGPNLIAVLLTGIGADGARGCLEIVKAGGITLVQDEATSTVYGMPKAAAELNAATSILPLGVIGQTLLEMVEKRSGN
jgi:two-component system response regulator WspF